VEWVSAAEGAKFQKLVTEIVEKTRELGPYEDYKAIVAEK
jgi:coenzyme F420-reducing hydrogenase delta subunit